jgi:four helix bundle protein
VPLNLAEGRDGIGGNRRVRYATALGSANEVIAAMEVAEALGYCAIDAVAMDKMQHVRAVLIKLVRR